MSENQLNVKTKEHIVSESTYIPEMGYEYPEMPDIPFLNPPKIREVVLDENYPYLDKSFKGRMRNFLVYLGIFCLVFPLNHLLYGIKFKGKKNLKKAKPLLKNGAMTIGNHVHRWDFLFILQAVKFRRSWFPARPSNIETSDANLILGAGGIPIPEKLSATRKFNQAFDELVSKKKWIHVFPESCRWDYYEPIRPFKIGAFKMAYRYKLPIIPIVISYRKPTGIWKLFGVKHPLITVSIGEVIPTSDSGEMSKNEFCNHLRKETHSKMCEMAGITQNCWEAEGD